MQALGIFDSGLGGLTVCSAIRKVLPDENIIYFGDTARVPYGPKSAKTIIRYAEQIAGFLLAKDVKAIIIACNTATSYSLEILRNKLNIPVLGVIQPGVDAATRLTKNNKIGIIGTKATINSGRYQELLKKRNPSLDILVKAAPMLVSIAEEGWQNHKITTDVIADYLDDIVRSGIDTLILGCTHFPLFKNKIREIYPELNLVDSSLEVARETKQILLDKNLLNGKDTPVQFQFYVSDITQTFEDQVKNFFGSMIPSVEVIQFE